MSAFAIRKGTGGLACPKKMSTEIDHAREIAERIARRVAGETSTTGTHNQTARSPQPKPGLTSELAAVRAGLSELQRKIAQLEAKVSSDPTEPPSSFSTTNTPSTFSNSPRSVPSTHSPWLAGVNASLSHPS